MELSELHQKVDQKLEKLDAEIERFKSNIEACDEAEQRGLLEKDLATLHVIREKLIKAKNIAQDVTDLRHQVDNPGAKGVMQKFGLSAMPRWGYFVLAGGVLAVILWWLF